MLRTTSVVLLLLVSSLTWAERNYQRGRLIDVAYHTENDETGPYVAYELTVVVGDIALVGRPYGFGTHHASDFVVNTDVEVRIDGNKMFLKRPDGKEFKTRIIRRQSLTVTEPQ